MQSIVAVRLRKFCRLAEIECGYTMKIQQKKETDLQL